MIAQLIGRIAKVEKDHVVLDVNGVGYEVFCSRVSIAGLDTEQSVKLVIHTEVRDDAIALYGFLRPLEKQLFLMLKTVKGLGAKSASEILASIESNDLLRAIGSSDVTSLQSVKGVGKKTAERIIVELRDKVGEFASNVSVSGGLVGRVEVSDVAPREEAVQALCALGFAEKEAQLAVNQVPVGNGSVDTGEIVKQALQHI